VTGPFTPCVAEFPLEANRSYAVPTTAQGPVSALLSRRAAGAQTRTFAPKLPSNSWSSKGRLAGKRDTYDLVAPPTLARNPSYIRAEPLFVLSLAQTSANSGRFVEAKLLFKVPIICP